MTTVLCFLPCCWRRKQRPDDSDIWSNYSMTESKRRPREEMCCQGLMFGPDYLIIRGQNGGHPASILCCRIYQPVLVEGAGIWKLQCSMHATKCEIFEATATVVKLQEATLQEQRGHTHLYLSVFHPLSEFLTQIHSYTHSNPKTS